MGNAERVLFPLANLMVFGLSVRWAIPVVRGTLRTLFGTKDLVMAVETVTSAVTVTSAAVANESVAAVTGRVEKESAVFDTGPPRLRQRHAHHTKSPQ